MSEHRSLPPIYRHTRATECARLRAVTFCRRLVAKPRTPHLRCAARAALQAASSQCKFSLGGSKGGISLFEKRYPSLVRAAPAGAAFPAPRKGESKGIPSSEREYPLCLAAAQSAATPPFPVRGNQKGIPSSEREYPLCPVQRQQALPSPFLRAQKKSRPMDGSHFCSISQCG